MILQKILNNTYYIVVIITMLYSIYIWLKKDYTEKQRYMFVYLIAVFLVDVLGIYLRKLFLINQYYFYIPFNLFSVFYFGYFFSKDYKSKRYKSFLTFITAVSLVLVSYLQFGTKSTEIDSRVFLVMVLFFLIISLQWFYYIVNHIDEQNITNKQAFWVSVALIIWSVFALFRLFLNRWLYDYNVDIFKVINYLFKLSNVIMYLMFLQGLRCLDFNILRTFNSFKK